MVKVSVVTICLNDKNRIRQTLESVLKQTYMEIEYVIKDGSSTDGTNDVIEECICKNRDKNIKHIIKKDM